MSENITNLKSCFYALINAYRSNAALNSWCLTEFSKKPSIQVGVDDEDPPELEPGSLAIHFIPGSRSRTRQMSKRSHGLVIRAYAHCVEKQTPESEVLVLEAVDVIDTFISLIEEATIPTLEKSGIAITPLEGQPDEIIHPFARAELAYLIEIPSQLP